VGGLSVLNAIAGAYSESLPVICLVGGPNSNDYGTNHVLHHTIGETDFSQEFRCFKEVTCAQVRPNDATSEIHWEKKNTKNTGHETSMEMQMETQQDTDVVQWFAQNSGWIIVYTYYLCYTPTVRS
jgi:TPP-dependent 2-oxoacid decarboxylase